MARRRHRASRRNPSPSGHWGAKIGGFFFGGVVPGVFASFVLGPEPREPELLPIDPLGQNAAAIAAYDDALARRARTWQAIDVATAIGAFLGTYRVKDPTAQAFLIGTSVGCLVRAASTPLLMATSKTLRHGGA